MEEIKGDVYEVTNEPDIIYIGVYQVGSAYWITSEIIYYSIDELKQNLAAFNPTRLLAVKVVIPKGNK